MLPFELVLGAALFTVTSLGCATQSPPPSRQASTGASVTSAPPPSPAQSAAPAVAATAEELADLVREPGWNKGSDPTSFDVGSNGLRLLLVDFQSGALPEAEQPHSFRRFALFAEGNRLLAQTTLEKSTGGLDQVEHESRDVDGDGKVDLVFYYFREEQWKNSDYGWIAATQAGQLVHAPLSMTLSGPHMLYASACWTSVEGRPVQFVNWHERSLDSQGKFVALGDRASAYAVDAQGLKAIALFGVVVAERPRLGSVLALVPKQHALIPLESDLLVPDCAPRGPAFVALPAPHHRWFLITGMALSKEHAAGDWPGDTPKPSHPTVVEIPKVEPSSWLIPPVQK